MSMRKRLISGIGIMTLLCGAFANSSFAFERSFVDRTKPGHQRQRIQVIKPHEAKRYIDRALKIGRVPTTVDHHKDSKLLVVSGKAIDHGMHMAGAVALAANGRNELVIRGVLRALERANAAGILEIAKSESTYCGINFDNLSEATHRIAHEEGITKAVVALHGDHYGIKNNKIVGAEPGPDGKVLMDNGAADIAKARKDIPRMIEAGLTSIAFDPSHLDPYHNLRVSIELARLWPHYLGLETEIGEIKGAEGLSNVAEALYQIQGLVSAGIHPDWIALNNGTTHGVQDASAGINVDLTADIHANIAKYLISGAQHGTSGNDYGRLGEIATRTNTTKANVATALQMISWGVKVDKFGNAVKDGKGGFVREPGHGVPEKLWNAMMAHAAKEGWSGGNLKKLNLPFAEDMNKLDHAVRESIVNDIDNYAYHLIANVFNAKDTAPVVAKGLVDAGSYDVGVKRGEHVTPEWTDKEMRQRAAQLDTDKGPDGDFDD